MALKIPREWLEFPEDAEDGAETTLSTSSTQEFQPVAPDEQPLEDVERFETDSDFPAAMDGEMYDETGIVMIELFVPVQERNLLVPERRNRHRRNGRNRRSRRSRRLRRSRSRHRRQSARQQDRPVEDTNNEWFGALRQSNRLHNRPRDSGTPPDNDQSNSPRR